MDFQHMKEMFILIKEIQINAFFDLIRLAKECESLINTLRAESMRV